MMVPYQEIPDRFAALPNKTLWGMAIESELNEGIKVLVHAHRYVFDHTAQVRGRDGKMLAQADRVMALYLLIKKISELTADAALTAEEIRVNIN